MAGSGTKVVLWIAGIAGGLGALLCGICGGVMVSLSRPPKASADAHQPWAFAGVELPGYSARGEGVTIEPGVVRHDISMGLQGGYYTTPGRGGKIWLYLPEGEHAPGSLPCIFICGAGSGLIYGMTLTESDVPEHVPYVRAGFAVVGYETDGRLPDIAGASDAARVEAMAAFRRSAAGMVNARNAVEFVLAHVPEVDPRRLYSAGHSSAATTSLLFAAHEPRLAGCIAYAPCVDIMQHLTPEYVRLLKTIDREAVDLVVRASPRTHEGRIRCPVFLFHAEDDSAVPVATVRECHARLVALGVDATLKVVPTGEHYDSMIREGIPSGIEWIRQLEAGR